MESGEVLTFDQRTCLIRPTPAATEARPADRTILFLRAGCIAFALVQTWVYRFQANPDGTAYRDIARAYLRCDWSHALNSYWSPLYSWLLAGVFAIIHPDTRSILPATHALQFCGFLLSMCGWELLYAEWERWQGPPAHRRALQLAGYGTLVWSSLHLVDLMLDTPDIFVVAILLLLAALLVRVRRGAGRLRDYAALGLLIGLAFLAKAACLVLLPVCLAILMVLLRSATDRRVWISCAAACIAIAPFVTALSLNKRHFVVSDTGRLNYTTLVGGFSLEGYKEGVTALPRNLPHPFTDRSSDVRVLSFEHHVTGTYPLHNDPVWWLEGLPTQMNAALQWQALRLDTLLSLWLFTGCPALLLLFLFFPACLGGVLPALRRLWFLIVPALVVVAGYSVIIVHARYIAGCFAILGFVPIATMWNIPLSPRRQRFLGPLMVCAMFFGMWLDIVSVPFYLIGELLHLNTPQGESNVLIAESLRRHGIAPQDRVGFIGNSVFASPWIELAEAQVVAIVPARVFHDTRTIIRPMDVTFEQPDRFWASSPGIQARTLDAMRAAGARWVFADNLPEGAKPDGWSVAGTHTPWKPERSGVVYFRKLEPHESPLILQSKTRFP